jgi:RNA polymerase sigma factor (sigma-70 family)
MNRPPRRPETAVHAAYRQYESSLKRFISRFLPKAQDIEDVAQETFLRAYVTEQGRAIEQPKSFLFRIAKNVALNQLARKSNQIIVHLEDLGLVDVLSTEATVEDELQARQTLGLHCEAVAALPPQCRRVYLLRKVYGLSHKDIAKRMGIAVSTVEKHLVKGMEECDRYVRTRSEPSRAQPGRMMRARGAGRGS